MTALDERPLTTPEPEPDPTGDRRTGPKHARPEPDYRDATPTTRFGPDPAPARTTRFGPDPAPARTSGFGPDPAPAPTTRFGPDPAPAPTTRFEPDPAPAPRVYRSEPEPQPPPAAVPPVPMWHRAVPNSPPRPPLVWLVGVHGGAGVSSLAASLSWAGDAGQRWPARIGLAADMDSPLVVLVARTNMRGLNALVRALIAHRQHATPAGSLVVGVVTVADVARPLPIPVAERRDEAEALAFQLGARTWRLGWLEQWRSYEPHELAEWTPAVDSTPLHDGDPTRTPPQPVRLLAEQILTAARSAGARITERAHRGAGKASP